MKLRKIPSTIETKLKFLETYLTKAIQNLYSENPCSWIRGLNTSPTEQQIQGNPYPIQLAFLQKLTSISKIYLEMQRNLNRQTILKKNKIGELTLSN